MQESDLRPAQHERSDISARLLWIGAPAVLLGVIALSGLVLALYPGGTTDRTLQLPLPHFPAPELQADPVSDMNRLHESQLLELNAMGWVDAQRHIVHIPIDQAMQQVAAEGIADWPTHRIAAHAP